MESQKQSREEFLQQALRLGGKVDSLLLSVKGPDGESLFLDFLWLGPTNPKRALVHAAGTHGVEGFLGSMIQGACLQQLTDIPKETAVIFVRCLNPWGMAFIRRVNADNIDLNRNFQLLDPQFHGVPEGYKKLAPWLNPQRPPRRYEIFYDRVLYYVSRYGFSALKQAIGAGQFEIPTGIYFGGNGLAEETRLFAAWFEKHLVNVESLWGIEIHSGLGPYGFDTLFLTSPDSNKYKTKRRVESIINHTLAPEDPQRGVGFETKGDLAKYVVNSRVNRQTTWLLQEFGTFNPVKVLKALRNENMHHHYGNGVLDHWSKRDLLNAFYPSDHSWREEVVKRGLDLFSRALAGQGKRSDCTVNPQI